ncbi:hypothetical protein JCM14036_26400 [Desulfotomaculum defluvii]
MVNNLVSAVLLAAGGAKRMGQPKQLLPLGGKPMVYQVAVAACGADLLEVIVITGAAGEKVVPVLTGLPLRILHNDNWETGRASGVRLAVQSLDVRAKAVLFLLADQPLVDKSLLNKMINTYWQSGANLVVPRWQNQRGNPVLFDLSCWRYDLLQLTGDQGARGILQAHPQCIQYLDVTSPEIFYDVDTPEDYLLMQQMWDLRERFS